MKVFFNSSSFECTDYLCVNELSNSYSSLIMKRMRVKRKNKFLRFKKWFEKEHDYCLPIINSCKLTEEEDSKDFEESDKPPLELVSISTLTNTEKIDVNDEIPTCSLYSIDVTELWKDALLESKKNYEQPTTVPKDCLISSDSNFVSNSSNQFNCNHNDLTLRLNNENKIQPSDIKQVKSCFLRESTPPKLYSPMDIDSDMIKLFPTLDFSMEHNLNEKQEKLDREIVTNNIILPVNMEETKKEIELMCDTSFTNTLSESSSRLTQLKNQEYKNVKSNCKVGIIQPILSNNSIKLPPVDSCFGTTPQLASEQYINIFNRYQCKSKEQFIEQIDNPGPVLLKDLLCGSKPKTIISPYTHRHLKPYIFRDPVTKPLWLQMLKEIKEYFRQKKGLPKCTEVETIDYSYVRAKHIKSVNTLASQFFWPGIDLTESLLYPDFSVIALYKNLVIGFGFMVPDISTNENYITFLFTRPYWTNSGIAKFMIYHLIQTCMTRDITLHVSPNNTAMILYQNFGFKIEEFVQNFYENYIPTESEMSKHALFLRLRSTFQRK